MRPHKGDALLFFDMDIEVGGAAGWVGGSAAEWAAGWRAGWLGAFPFNVWCLSSAWASRRVAGWLVGSGVACRDAEGGRGGEGGGEDRPCLRMGTEAGCALSARSRLRLRAAWPRGSSPPPFRPLLRPHDRPAPTIPLLKSWLPSATPRTLPSIHACIAAGQGRRARSAACQLPNHQGAVRALHSKGPKGPGARQATWTSSCVAPRLHRLVHGMQPPRSRPCCCCSYAGHEVDSHQVDPQQGEVGAPPTHGGWWWDSTVGSSAALVRVLVCWCWCSTRRQRPAACRSPLTGAAGRFTLTGTCCQHHGAWRRQQSAPSAAGTGWEGVVIPDAPLPLMVPPAAIYGEL